MPGIDRTKNFCVMRLQNPKTCSPESFRTITPNKDTRIRVCCPKGKFNKQSSRCRVSLIRQSIMKRKLKGDKCPSF